METNSMKKSLTSDKISIEKIYGTKSLFSVKQSRKQIEHDAQILANRIALLRQEELKSWKKIEETKKKAREVYLLKKSNEDRLANKQNRQKNLEDKRQDHAMVLQEIRKQRELEKKQILAAIHDQKHKEMLDIKKQRDINEKKQKDIKEKAKQDNFLKSQLVKQQEELTEIRKKEFLEQKLKLMKLENNKLLEQEEKVKTVKEMEVLNMEQIEMELIRKLQHTQVLQKAAYEELETALSQPPEEYAQKYMAKSDKNSRQKLKLSGTFNSSPGNEFGQGMLSNGFKDNDDQANLIPTNKQSGDGIDEQEKN